MSGSDSEPQPQPGEPFPISLSRGGAPAFSLSATKELAYGIRDGSLSPEAAAQLLAQQRADPNGRYYNTSSQQWHSLVYLAAEECVGEDGVAILESLIDAGANVNCTSPARIPLDAVLARLRHADPTQLSALLPMIETLLRHGARCYFDGALSSVFTSGATRGPQRITAKECLKIVTRLTAAAAAAPTLLSLYGYWTLEQACACRFAEDEDKQSDEQQQQRQQQEGDAAHDGHADPHIAILEKLVEGMGREVVEGDGGTCALNEATRARNRAVVYWLVRQQGVKAVRSTLILAHWDVDVISFLVHEAGADIDDDYLKRSVPTHAMRFINASLTPLRTLSALSASHRVFRVGVLCSHIASYIEPPPLPFSARTPLGRRLNAALSFFVSRVCNVASPSVRRRLFRHTAFVTPHTTHADTSDSQGGREGGQVDEGIVYGLRDVIHLIWCEEALHYRLPDIDRGFGKGKPFECSFDGRVVVGGAGGGQCVVQTIDGWEGMDQRGPPGAVWGDYESSDDDSSDGDDLDEESDIDDEDGMDADGLEDAGDGDDLDEGSVAEDGMDGDWGEEEHDGDMIEDDDEHQHMEDDQAAGDMDEEHSSSNLNPPV
ncbi:unnamed protein product [Vitrella brassicaformis CCMP3155]|uniref:Uncharacterized protein n=1 Tax=Vitrella brassicaformis (strain CCMP3155) TaxID=1169540 RepID=A0A0G4H1D4_VITBC|nr:unnamed protein product [Vitrella brassicaformis CCMP3155]|eukprot:CEM37413.1 unnamed protein product [Vitrella brassicaformis CCMP3155]